MKKYHSHIQLIEKYLTKHPKMYLLRQLFTLTTNFNYTFVCFSKNRIYICKNIIQSIKELYHNSRKLEAVLTQCDVLSKRGRSARYSYNVYDTQGKPFMLRVNGKRDYFYLYNGLGDVTSLVDSSNKVVVRYQYNRWRKVTST